LLIISKGIAVVTSTLSRNRVAGTLLVLALGVAAPACRAGDLSITPEARKVFDAVVKAYKDAPSYSDEGSFNVTFKASGKPQKQTVPVKLSWAKPDKLAVDAGDVRMVSDGKTLTSVIVPTKKFFELPSPKRMSVDAIAEGPIGSLLAGGPAGEPAKFILGLLMGDTAAKALPDKAKTLRLEADRSWMGRNYNALYVDQGAEPGWRMYVDPTTQMVHRVEYVIDPKTLAEKLPPGADISDFNVEWTSGAVKTAPAEAFAFKSPEGFSKISAAEAAAAARGGDAEAPRIEAMVGKAAPEFTFTAFDAAGKFKKVQKADLAGKVVLMNFWATWCGPCIEEMPELQRIVERFGKDPKKDVVFVLVNQDKEPADDPKGIRKLIETTFLENKLNFAQKPNVILGLDADEALTALFEVEYLPSTLIIGPDGVVQTVHVGAGYPVFQTLTKEIETVLQGKSLIPATAGAAAKPASAKP
jgi:thiol-disulfide isomerase/thioredoxin